MSILAFVSDQHSIGEILDHLGLRPLEHDRPPPPRDILRVAEPATAFQLVPCRSRPPGPPLAAEGTAYEFEVVGTRRADDCHELQQVLAGGEQGQSAQWIAASGR